MERLIEKYRNVLIAIGFAVVMVVIGVLASRDQEPTGTQPLAGVTTTLGRPVTTIAESDLAGVPPFDCGPLLTLDDIDFALGDGEIVNTLEISKGDICRNLAADDEGLFVQISPGKPGDFEPGALVLGVTGVPVAGVGDEALWFGGEQAEGGGDVGILSVRAGTELGELHFQIALGRPGLGGEAQLQILTTLATNAYPRFPGVAGPEPVTITFTRHPPDAARLGLADNLLAREADGEWTRGEGLVTTLRYLNGELDAGVVLREPELSDNSATGVFSLAREFLADPSDSVLEEEIGNLLDALTITRHDTTLTGESGAAGLQFVSLAATAAGQQSDCEVVWWGPGACLVKLESVTLEEAYGSEKYLIFHPELPPGGEVAGWTQEHVDWTADAMEQSAAVFEGWGEMPTIDIWFTPFQKSLGASDVHTELAGLCTIFLNVPLQSLPAEYFKQWIAAEMAHCFIAKNYQTQLKVGYPVYKWWENGLAVYLSGVAFAQANFEWVQMPDVLAAEELEKTMLDRDFSNWAFFESFDSIGGTQAVLDLISTLPGKGGRGDQEAALAAFPGIDEVFDIFAQRLSDEALPDKGGSTVPYDAPSWEATFDGPAVVIEETLPFGVYRLDVAVPAGKTACVEYDHQGESTISWRNGPSGAPGGAWTSDLSSALRAESVFQVTTTKPGARFSIQVNDVSTEPDCQNDEPSGGGDCLLGVICDPSGYYFKVITEN